MKIQFLEDTFIRKSLDLPVADPIGVVYKGLILEVEDEPHIAEFSIEHNDRWYRDHNGWYYWSGGSEMLPAEVIVKQPRNPAKPKPEPPPPPPIVVNTPSEVENKPDPAGAKPKPESPPPIVAVVPPQTETIPDPVHTTLFFDLTHLPDGIVIPEGETRFVPMPSNAQNTPGTRGLDDLESLRGMPEADREIDPFPLKIIEWSDLDPAKINWGIQQNALQQDWWQQRRLTGRGVKIALIYTGADLSHPDLEGAVTDFYYSPEDTSGTFEDTDGLGTQIALIAAGRGREFIGVAPEASLLIARVGHSERDITPENLLAGLKWALDNGAEIVAMLADFRDLDSVQKETFKKVIDQAMAQNVLFLAPVGNSGERRPQRCFPASFEGVLCVGAHDSNGKRSVFSAKSFQLDLLAPGEALLPSTPQTAGNLKTTAVATAFTAGFLALLRQWEHENKQVIEASAVINLLRNTADANKATTKGEDIEYGYGNLNPAGLLNQLESK